MISVAVMSCVLMCVDTQAGTQINMQHADRTELTEASIDKKPICVWLGKRPLKIFGTVEETMELIPDEDLRRSKGDYPLDVKNPLIYPVCEIVDNSIQAIVETSGASKKVEIFLIKASADVSAFCRRLSS